MNPAGKILVALGNHVHRAEMARLLAGAGHTVGEAADGPACLTAVVADSPDLVLVSAELPELNGVEVCRRLKNDPLLTHIQVILILPRHGASVPTADCGADELLMAPIVEAELSARVRAALRFMGAERALHASETRLHLAMAAANVGFFDWDIAANRIVFSSRWKAQLGHAPGDFPDTFAAWEGRVHPDDRARMLAAVRDCLDHPRPEFDGEWRLRHKDGSYRTVVTRAIFTFDAAGRPARMLGTQLDVTDRVQLEAKLRAAHQLESVGQFAGGVAHEFNNILTIIQGRVSLLQTIGQLPPEGVESLQQIVVAAGRAASLTRQLLTFSQRQVMQPRQLDLGEVAANLVPVLAPLVGSRVKLRLERAPGLPAIRGDAVMMEQLLLNLALNSREAMPEGGQFRLQITPVELDTAQTVRHPEARAGRFVRLRVSDTGRGIEPEILPQIFEPFFTTKNLGKGTGMGLTTVAAIVKEHAGWIEVEGRPGHGAAFTIFLPVVAAPAAATVAISSPGGLPQTGGKAILLVEDEPEIREITELFLRDAGHVVFSAETGPEALVVWAQHGPQIGMLLTDMAMPGGMTGRELAERLLAEQPTLKVIYTSGYSLAGLAPQADLREGFNYLQKPFSPGLLLNLVSERLAHGG